MSRGSRDCCRTEKAIASTAWFRTDMPRAAQSDIRTDISRGRTVCYIKGKFRVTQIAKEQKLPESAQAVLGKKIVWGAN
jgi:hypothetical protein